MVNSLLSYFVHQSWVRGCISKIELSDIFSFFREGYFYILEIYQNTGLVLSSVMLVLLFCLNEIRRKALHSGVQIEFETEDQKHILGLWYFTCVFQPPFPFICFEVMPFFSCKVSEPIACLSRWVFTSQLVPLSQQDYLPESPHHHEKTPTTQHKTMRSQSGPLQLAQHCQGFTFLLKSHNEQPSEEEVNKAVMHIDSNTISLLIFFPKVKIAELVWHMMFCPFQQNTY